MAHSHEANRHPTFTTSSYTASPSFRSVLHAATWLATLSSNSALATHIQHHNLGRLGLERARAAQARPISPNASRQALTITKPTVPTASEEFSMKCVDGPSRIHACMFEGLVYDTHSQTFFFPGIDEPSSSAQPQQQHGSSRESAAAGDAVASGDTVADDHSKSHIDFLQKSTPSSKFHMGGLIKPPAEDTCTVADKIHLRNPFHANSFGHFLRDNLQALVEISSKLDVDPAEFSWVSWPEIELDKLPHVVIKYRDWMGGKKMRQWKELLERCTEINGGTPPRYLKLEHVIASGAGSDWTTSGTVQQPACNSTHFQPLRTLAYRQYYIPHVPVHHQSVPLVTILAAVEGEKRAIANVDQLVKTVQAHMPDVRVEVHGMMRESPEEQMHILARTSVLVTNIGSSSFRQIYLPDGAQVILIGALEAPFKGTDGATYTIPGSFREVSRCWGGVTYWNTIPYHVRTEAEITRHAGRTGSVHTQGDEYWEVLRVWDADVTIDPSRFMKLLRIAMGRVRPPPLSASETEVMPAPH